jgi:hypothetical protein
MRKPRKAGLSHKYSEIRIPVVSRADDVSAAGRPVAGLPCTRGTGARRADVGWRRCAARTAGEIPPSLVTRRRFARAAGRSRIGAAHAGPTTRVRPTLSLRSGTAVPAAPGTGSDPDRDRTVALRARRAAGEREPAESLSDLSRGVSGSPWTATRSGWAQSGSSQGSIGGSNLHETQHNSEHLEPHGNAEKQLDGTPGH